MFYRLSSRVTHPRGAFIQRRLVAQVRSVQHRDTPFTSGAPRHSSGTPGPRPSWVIPMDTVALARCHVRSRSDDEQEYFREGQHSGNNTAASLHQSADYYCASRLYIRSASPSALNSPMRHGEMCYYFCTATNKCLIIGSHELNK